MVSVSEPHTDIIPVDDTLPTATREREFQMLGVQGKVGIQASKVYICLADIAGAYSWVQVV